MRFKIDYVASGDFHAIGTVSINATDYDLERKMAARAKDFPDAEEAWAWRAIDIKDSPATWDNVHYCVSLKDESEAAK